MSYFGEYGRICYCQIGFNAAGFDEHALVHFENAEDAAKVLSKKYHRILNKRIVVNIAGPRHREHRHRARHYGANTSAHEAKDHSSLAAPSTESTNVSGTHLTRLNDDCWIEILSYLNLRDLCSVSETCSRLHVLACLAFRKLDYVWAVTQSSLYDTRRILTNFGPLITKVLVDGRQQSRDIHWRLNMFQQYCGDAIDNVELRNLYVTKSSATKLQKIFTKFKRIKLSNVDLHQLANSINLFANCWRLEELSIKHSYTWVYPYPWESTFPTLTSLELDYSVRVDDMELMSNFLFLHPNLKKLHLKKQFAKFAVCEEIANKLKKLEDLHITFDCCRQSECMKSIEKLVELRQLKRLHLTCNGNSISAFLNKSKSMHSLEYLSLCDTIGDHAFFLSVAKYNKIRKLELSGINYLADICGIIPLQELEELCLDRERYFLTERQKSILNESLVDLVAKLPKLRKIEVPRGFALDDITYTRLVEIVAQQPSRATLKIHNYGLDFAAKEFEQSSAFVKYYSY